MKPEKVVIPDLVYVDYNPYVGKEIIIMVLMLILLFLVMF